MQPVRSPGPIDGLSLRYLRPFAFPQTKAAVKRCQERAGCVVLEKFMPLFFAASPALPIPTLPTSLPAAAAVPESIKAALPALTVMLVNGALNLVAASIILVAGWTVARWLARWTHNFLTHATHVDET